MNVSINKICFRSELPCSKQFEFLFEFEVHTDFSWWPCPPSSCFMIKSWQCPVPSPSWWAPVLSLYCQRLSLSQPWEHSHIPRHRMHDQSFHIYCILFNLCRGFNVCILNLVFSVTLFLLWSGCWYFEALSQCCLDAKSGYWPRSKVPSQVPTVTAHLVTLFSLVEMTEAGLWLVQPPSVQLMQLHTQTPQAAQAKIYCALCCCFRLSQERETWTTAIKWNPQT